MRRSLFCAVFFGMLVALLPAGAAAAESCDKEDFGARLKCWSTAIKAGVVPVTLDDQVPFDAKDPARRDAERTLRDHRENLVVEVPSGGRTGGGGTALLLLAGSGWVAGDATIDDLPDAAREDLEKLSLCGETAPDDLEKLCAKLAAGPIKGKDLIEAADGAYRPPQSYPGSTNGNSSYPDPLLVIVSALLIALLTAFVLVIRRSSRAAPHRTLATAGGGTVPTTNSRAADEKTTHLRVEPATRHGRRVGNVPGPARSAVVRTELHPQGYVELGRVLYRAVWAEPGRPPPAPGQLVDVTDARERDSDVLYAFPPTTGRHAKGTRS
ncbi:hypothetical protein OHT59_17175 [Streptomyces sp. NBC_00243]|uniref:hypothetical protein n=1 Tax=Streptomyces sp. NBC_00243 TaxID=2975688 RepID=UPI002DD85CA2|nr:hypothetical protein [Streptomyces sp. NBC_00243]WRZ20105.1 hypothetical protein OHT59_17175 [Streptomyces sp. NBC_00243]